MQYIALLRGINVGGNRLIKMVDLAKIFSLIGCTNVKTFIASGNVIFEFQEDNPTVVTGIIEQGLLKSLGYEVKVILRTIDELKEIVELNPFKNVPSHTGVKFYVTFLFEAPSIKPKLPVISAQKDFEIIHINNREVFSISLALPNGRFGNPVSYIDKEFKILSTTRNWNTVKKIVLYACATELQRDREEK